MSRSIGVGEASWLLGANITGQTIAIRATHPKGVGNGRDESTGRAVKRASCEEEKDANPVR